VLASVTFRRRISEPIMAMQHAVLFAVVVAAIVAAIARWRVEPLLALLLGAAAFGIVIGMSVGQIGKSFGTGFGAAAGGTGLAVVAAAWIGAMAEAAGVARFGHRDIVARVTPLVGVVAGMGASPAAAFALLRPLGDAVSMDPVRLALAISIGQGLLLPSPVMLAATTILGADWRLVLAIGVPCAALIAVAAGFLRRFSPPAPISVVHQAPAQNAVWPAAGLIAVSVAVTALLIVRALGDIPSEPFGGGSARELLLGLGRPYILLLVGICGMAAFCARTHLVGVSGVAIARAAPMVLLLGAAGGLQSVAQDSRMADSLAEGLSGWHVGLAAPFLVASCLKMLVGSSPVAAISAAGLLQPALAGLALDDPAGHACAALAVGAGAMAGTHVNDGFFWLVNDRAGRGVQHGMVWLFGGTLLQGAVAVAMLWLVHAGWHAT
jgi:GntP family gluconate:H+ symporter